MKEYVCKKCGAVNHIRLEKKGTATGIYCTLCDSWLKWIGKDEIKFAEQIINSNNSNEEQTKLNNKKTTEKERVESELAELIERKDKLFRYLDIDKFKFLSHTQRDLLCRQYNIMIEYIEILEERLKNWED